MDLSYSATLVDMESLDPELEFGGYFERRPFTKDTPHIMICLKHELAHDERLFRAEVLAILAAIQSRMQCPDFDEHVIFPVCHRTLRDLFTN
jgi:hypothetical protein